MKTRYHFQSSVVLMMFLIGFVWAGVGCDQTSSEDALGTDTWESATPQESVGESVEDDVDSEVDISSGVWLTSADYALDWTWENAEFDADGQGWTIVNDLGYRIHVERGYIVNYSASLAPCDPTASLEAPSFWLAALDFVLGAGVAHAGHGDEADPSASATSMVEDLANPSRFELDSLAFSGDLYCWFHYLVARADTGTEGMPEDADMEGISLHLEGEWSNGTDDATPFVLHTSVAHGTLPHFEQVLEFGPDASVEAAAVTVLVERNLDTLFDGLDLASVEMVDVERGVLSNLMKDVRVKMVVHDSL